MTEGRPGEEALVCFESVAQAIMAEQALAERKFPVRVMPTPSSIRGGCGFCLRFLPQDLAGAAAFLAERGITLSEAYLREPEGAAYRKLPLNTEHGGPDGKRP
ncbi:MAG: DUF3343 domain-containing protein [Treponema sp.]|jgi:hypothetical protein|nr:DUF3343 domain-containing protein [Treponema sp.]